MDVPTMRPGVALLIGTAVAAGAVAQSDPDAPNQPVPVPGQVLSDVQPLPAEDRDSEGALVLPESRVRAQREASGANAQPNSTSVPSAIGRRVSRVLERAQDWDEPPQVQPVPIPPAEPALP